MGYRDHVAGYRAAWEYRAVWDTVPCGILRRGAQRSADPHCAAQLSLPWVYTGKLSPVSTHGYSSTNFVLLGLVLAKFANATSWDTLDQVPLRLRRFHARLSCSDSQRYERA